MATGTTTAISNGPRGGRGWQVLRESFREFLVNKPAKFTAGQVLAEILGVIQSDEAKVSEAHSAVDRTLSNIIGHINKETPEGAKSAEIWEKARTIYQEVRVELQTAGWRPPTEAGSLNQFMNDPSSSGSSPQRGKNSKEDAMALFPTKWCTALSADLMADLIVDAMTGPIVDAFLDGAVELLDAHEGWCEPAAMGSPRSRALPSTAQRPSRTFGASSSSTTLGFSLAADSSPKSQSSSMGGFSPSHRQLPLPPRMPAYSLRALERPFRSMPPNDNTKLLGPRGGNSPTLKKSASEGFAMAPRTKGDSWNLRKFHGSLPLDSYERRIRESTEMQRPKRRLRRPERDPLGPKYSLPMLATNFAAGWDGCAPLPPKEKTAVLSGSGAAAAAAMSSSSPTGEDEDDEWDEEEPQGYSWLQRKGRDGKTLFPYSLVSHRAFLDSQTDPVLKEKAMKIAPLRMTSSHLSESLPW
eukprot:TRINITY_DN4712_c2_g1_i1.p1 TRINITY_DN4712_c2_g1~~TRINITY_DN4712_c2_g1_i1.p1  ORF type:complete len:469 (+),score=84.13 TRINITY_DN4712_c2_g1_i1:77-1483(+)